MKRVLCTIGFVGLSLMVMAVPAKRGPFPCTAGDGTTRTVYQHGNEWFHYLTDAEGNWLDEQTLRPIGAEQRQAKLEAGMARRARRAPSSEQAVTRLLAPRGPIILVSYQDQPFSATNAEMTQWAMGDTYTYQGATGSIRQYFYDQSWGQYNMQIDVIGPVTLSREAAYYGTNDEDGNDEHAADMIVEACRLAAAQGADFSQYDSNGDGYVDWVVVLYAGKGENDHGGSKTIWPHQFDLSYTGDVIQLGGKYINHYCCLNELDGKGKRCGIGTFCHEFSHIMGLPDLYATGLNAHSAKTMGQWDIMDYGPYNNNGNTPPAYSAYERWFMGWLEPTLLSTAASVTLGPLNEGRAAAYLTIVGSRINNIQNPNPNTFYMLENRRQTGWDTYLPGHGLLITKIYYRQREWAANTVNNSTNNMGVDIIEADGLAPAHSTLKPDNGYFGKPGDAYPEGATSFTDVVNFPITLIAENDGLITFDVKGGGAEIHLDVEDASEAGAQSVKQLHNGQLLIRRGDAFYDILGRLVR